MLFLAVDGTDKGRFARAGRAEDNYHFLSLDREIDIAQCLKIAIPFIDITHNDHVILLW
jgi:hypothetical protein